jgi:hypothetical protein
MQGFDSVGLYRLVPRMAVASYYRPQLSLCLYIRLTQAVAACAAAAAAAAAAEVASATAFAI